MSIEYDSDNFDMEQVSGVDNPIEPGDSYDAGVGNEARANVPSRKPKPIQYADDWLQEQTRYS